MATEAAARPELAPEAGLPGWVRACGGVLVAVAAVEAALLEAFYVPLHLHTVPLPVSPLAAVVGNVLLPRLMYAATRTRWASAVPAVLWLVVMIGMAIGRPEGDVVLPGTWIGLIVLFGGTAAAVFGATRALPPRP